MTKWWWMKDTDAILHDYTVAILCYNFSYFALFTYDLSLFLEVSHGAATLTHFSLTNIAATLLTHFTAVVLTHSIAILMHVALYIVDSLVDYSLASL